MKSTSNPGHFDYKSQYNRTYSFKEKNTMPRNSSARKNKRPKRNEAGLDGIQLAGIGVIVLVLAAVIWLAIANRPPAAPASTEVAPVAAPKQYDSPPPMTIDVTRQYFATVKMAKGGEFVIQLFPDKAPITVNNFVFLADQGFYNGVTFHRVLEGFMAQGGDPTGTGGGGPGYEFVNEKNDLAFDKPGVVAMANAGPDTNGSQFFITFGPYGLKESDYTIFGQVTSGMDVVNGLTRRDPDQNPAFPGDAIESVTISEK
jgi:peptidylprolyl isomerase